MTTMRKLALVFAAILFTLPAAAHAQWDRTCTGLPCLGKVHLGQDSARVTVAAGRLAEPFDGTDSLTVEASEDAVVVYDSEGNLIARRAAGYPLALRLYVEANSIRVSVRMGLTGLFRVLTEIPTDENSAARYRGTFWSDGAKWSVESLSR